MNAPTLSDEVLRDVIKRIAAERDQARAERDVALAERDAERAETARLRAMLTPDVGFLGRLGMPPQQARILSVLVDLPIASSLTLQFALYGNEANLRDANTVKVFISHLRRRLRVYGVPILSAHGHGYWLLESDRPWLRDLRAGRISPRDLQVRPEGGEEHPVEAGRATLAGAAA